jgi:hypothetical protein
LITSCCITSILFSKYYFVALYRFQQNSRVMHEEDEHHFIRKAGIPFHNLTINCRLRTR